MNLPIKYRPIEFAQVVGQRVAVAIAQASLMQTPLQTTFLLVGASGSGKTTLARIMARSLNCQEKVGVEPCNQCSSCLSHLNDNHLAINEINGADKNGVDDVRGIIERCQVNTIDSKYRVFIVDECHQMSKPAQNAMLKLLEDPPQDTIFILCTTEEDKLLETIRSRARILRFGTVPRDLVTGYLLNVAYHEGIALSEHEAQRIYEYNKGSIRQSLQTLGTVCPHSGINEGVSVADLCPQIARDELQSLFIAFENRDYIQIDRVLPRVFQQGFYPKQLLTDLIDLAIEIMAMPETSPHFVANANRILKVVIPTISKLGTSSNARINCRLALYHALTVWQPSENKETVEAIQTSPLITDASSPGVSQPSPNVLADRVQTQSQSSQALQVASLSAVNQLPQSSFSVPQHQFAFPTGHRPYIPAHQQ